MRKKIQLIPFYLFLLPLFFVFHGFVDNFYFVSVGAALVLLLIYIVTASLITAVFYIFLKNLSKAALLTAFIFSFHFFFGYIHDGLKSVFNQSFVTRFGFIIPIFLLLLIILFFFLKRRKTFYKLTSYLNILFVFLILLDAGFLLAKIPARQNNNKANNLNELTICDTCKKPDIYLLLLDEYAGDDELKNLFAFDNTPFFDSLTQRGFKVIQHSKSNYNYTPYSTASILNLDYLDSASIKNNKRGFSYAMKSINNSRLISFLLANSYSFYNYSVFQVEGQASPTGGSFVPTDTKLITENTFLSRMEKEVLPNLATNLNVHGLLKQSMYAAWKDNKSLYDATIKVSETKSKSPKLVYTHLLMPHYPYYYNEKGDFLPYEHLRQSSLEDSADYLSYLKYTNKKITELVDHILKASSSPPVIVLFSDHGYRQFKESVDPKYHFSNLLSVYLPGKDYHLFSDSMSNVNFFRTLLNSEFRQKLPLLEEKTVFVNF